ncbi:hypothetical protein WM04_15585 [Burkholderia ubonensis]|uniref:type III secretion system cytoplasmic ring protein SctQ n=1 Tax=Burkholderia ubonensis TaxID=101571 RepID=UPI000755A0B7|nr:type III secretion system cytoplasmic ring protein SctQ [Burkholderia ubonensis]KWI31346.1 hypothetical protein WM04_15585 [Burkholderia ubonensis]OJB15016.1 hypothetical protein BGV53_23050 [Burkholderia ubonensis]
MIATAPLRLPDVAPCTARVARLIFDARLHALLARVPGVTDCHMSIVADDPGDESAMPFSDRGLISLARQAYTLSIEIDLAAHPALSVVARAVDSADTDEHALRDAIAGALLAPLTTALEQAGFGGWRIAALARARDDTRPASIGTASVVSLSLLLNGERYRARVVLNPTLVRDAEELLRAQPPVHANPLASFPVPGRLCIGAKSFQSAVLRSLVPGDVLLGAIEPAAGAAGMPFSTVAIWGTRGRTQLLASVQFDGRTAVLLKDPFMVQEADHPGNEVPDRTDPVAIGALEVPVNFEIDTVALPIDQLAAMRQGYVIELSRSPSDMQVRLIAHGQLIGHGELVSVGEHLGVRILQMAQRDDSGR